MAGRIQRIELWHVSVPLPSPSGRRGFPGYPQTHVAQTFARLRTSDGLTGETAGPAFTTERRGLGDLLGGFLLGMAADDMDGFRKRLREASYLGWRNWWLEAAPLGPRREDGRQARLQAPAAPRADRLPRPRLRLERRR